jgi:hypothetical protein
MAPYVINPCQTKSSFLFFLVHDLVKEMAPKALAMKALKKTKDRDEFGQPQHNHGLGTVGDLIKIFLAMRLGYSEGMATWQSLIIFLLSFFTRS